MQKTSKKFVLHSQSREFEELQYEEIDINLGDESNTTSDSDFSESDIYIHSSLSVSTQFYFYEVTTRYVDMNFESAKYKGVMHFFCGVFSGCIAATFVNPLEVIKVRQIIDKSVRSSLIFGAKKVYDSGGIFAFYEGLSAALVQIGPQVGITFAVFRTVQEFMLHLLSRDCELGVCAASRDVGSVAAASAIAGSVAGVTSKTLTYPFELAKKRLQIKTLPAKSEQVFKCNSLKECLVKTFQEEGVKGLFRGFKITLYKAQFSGLVAFTTYELICYFTKKVIGPTPQSPAPLPKHCVPKSKESP